MRRDVDVVLPIKSPGLLDFFLLHIYSPKKIYQTIWEKIPYPSQAKHVLPSVGLAAEPGLLDSSAMKGICLPT